MTGVAKLMSVEDVCDYLGVSRYFVYDQVRLGVLPCARIARQLRFRPADIETFVERRLFAAGAPLRAVDTPRQRGRATG